MTDNQKTWLKDYGKKLGVWLLMAVVGVVIGLLSGKKDVVIPAPPTPEPFPVGMGWVSNPQAVQAVVASLPPGEREFSTTPAGRLVFGEDTDVYLWDAARQVTGDVLPARNQGSVGSCVAFGTVAAVEHLLCAQIVANRKQGRPDGTFRPLAQEVVYAGGRVEVGGGRIQGDGLIGAWAADWGKRWGMVARGIHGAHDLQQYDERRCRDWGYRGVPDDLEPLAKESPVRGVTLVTSADAAVKALRQGYPIAVCSDQGFTMTRGADGFCEARGSWAHCMAILGYQTGPRRGFWIQNSWGASAHTGPKGKGNPPDGGFWADFAVVDRMLRQGDSWAFSDAAGFPARPLDWFVHRNTPRRIDLRDNLFALAP